MRPELALERKPELEQELAPELAREPERELEGGLEQELEQELELKPVLGLAQMLNWHRSRHCCCHTIRTLSSKAFHLDKWRCQCCHHHMCQKEMQPETFDHRCESRHYPSRRYQYQCSHH
jgi:hypothetical protein